MIKLCKGNEIMWITWDGGGERETLICETWFEFFIILCVCLFNFICNIKFYFLLRKRILNEFQSLCGIKLCFINLKSIKQIQPKIPIIFEFFYLCQTIKECFTKNFATISICYYSIPMSSSWLNDNSIDFLLWTE